MGYNFELPEPVIAATGKKIVVAAAVVVFVLVLDVVVPVFTQRRHDLSGIKQLLLIISFCYWTYYFAFVSIIIIQIIIIISL